MIIIQEGFVPHNIDQLTFLKVYESVISVSASDRLAALELEHILRRANIRFTWLDGPPVDYSVLISPEPGRALRELKRFAIVGPWHSVDIGLSIKKVDVGLPFRQAMAGFEALRPVLSEILVDEKWRALAREHPFVVRYGVATHPIIDATGTIANVVAGLIEFGDRPNGKAVKRLEFTQCGQCINVFFAKKHTPYDSP